jgi:chromosome segregation ATPase
MRKQTLTHTRTHEHIVQDKFKEQVHIMREKDAAREEKIKELERQKEDSTTFVSNLEGRVEAYRLRIEQLESDISDEQVQKQVLIARVYICVCVHARLRSPTETNVSARLNM